MTAMDGKMTRCGRVEQEGAGVVQHGAPTGGGRRDAETQETERGFSEDGSCHADGGLHGDGLQNVR